MSTNKPKPPINPELSTTIVPFVLSCIAIIAFTVALILGRIDSTLFIASIGVIVGGNGLYGATRWQAAPNVVGTIETALSDLTAHNAQLHSFIQSVLPMINTVIAQTAQQPQATTAQVPVSTPIMPQQSASGSVWDTSYLQSMQKPPVRQK